MSLKDDALGRLERAVERRRMSRWGRFFRYPCQTIRNSAVSRLSRLLPASVHFAKTAPMITGDPLTLVWPSGSLDLWFYGAPVDCDAEIRLTRYLLRALNENDVFFDLGANLGYYSLLASRLVGNGGSVRAFEPSPPLVEILKRNVGGRGNVRVVEKAVGDSAGPAEFYIAPTAFMGTSSLLRGWQERETKAVSVETIRLDDYCLSEGVVPQLIKVDVEGAEALVLKGARRLLSESRPRLAIEFVFGNREGCAPVLEMLEGMEYRPFAIREDGGLERLGYEGIGRYFDSLRERYAVVQDAVNDFDNLVFVWRETGIPEPPRAPGRR